MRRQHRVGRRRARRHITRRFALALQARFSEPGLLRFRDRVEFVAAALVAFAEGRAERCWWLAEFDGLHRLSRSTALRTLLINEADAGVTALARLTDGALAGVLGTLSEGDGARLLAWFALRPGTAEPPLAALWQSAAELALAGPATVWLRALVGSERARSGSAGAACLRCLRSLGALHALVRDGALVAAELAADPRARAATGAGGKWAERRLARGRSRCRARRRLPRRWSRAQRLVPMAWEREAPAAWLVSPHGGLFVLLGCMQRLGWLEHWQAMLRTAWPDASDAEGGTGTAPVQADALSRALALRVASHALAGEDAARVLADPAVRAVCGLDGTDEAIDRHACLVNAALRAVPGVRRSPGAAIDPQAQSCDGEASRPGHVRAARLSARLLSAAAARLLEECGHAVPGLTGSSPTFLRAQALALPVRLRTGERGADSVVRLGRAPLDVLLVLAGAKRIRIELPGFAAIRCVEDVGA